MTSLEKTILAGLALAAFTILALNGTIDSGTVSHVVDGFSVAIIGAVAGRAAAKATTKQ